MKTLKLLYLIVGSLFLSLTACDGIIDPAPSPSEKIDSETYIYSQTFKNGIGDFTQYNDSGKQVWTPSSNQYVMISGNVDNVPYANVDWFISPAITLPNAVSSVMTFDFVTRDFADLANEATIWISEDYNKDSLFSKATWTQIFTVEAMVNAAGWNMTNAGDISLKAYMGKKITIAFKYVSSNNQAGTWQLKNFVVKERKPVSLPHSETFAASKGKFSAINVSGAQYWLIDSHGYATISGYVSSINNANEDWLISPQIDMTKVAKAKLTFDHVARYFANPKTEATLWYSENYDEGLPSTATWKQLKTYAIADPGNWTLSTSHEIGLDSCVGKKVSIAFKYISTAAKAGTWELKNFYVQEGAPSDIYFFEAFDESLGKFTTNNVLGAQTWYFNSSSKYAIVSGFANSVSNANEDWLISPSIDMIGKTAAKLSFDHTINKGLVANMQANHTLWLSADNGTTWEQITIPTYPAGNTWTFVNSGNIVIPDKFLGINSFKFAFKYLCSTAESASWEMRNIIIKP
jgi:hypothetical protein